jgi:hypothetical protein
MAITAGRPSAGRWHALDEARAAQPRTDTWREQPPDAVAQLQEQGCSSLRAAAAADRTLPLPPLEPTSSPVSEAGLQHLASCFR